MIDHLFPRAAVKAARGFALLLAATVAIPAFAGSGANFVTYNHHTADQGEIEVKLFTDVSEGAGSDYFAQLVEIEYGVTDRWTTALYFEGVDSDGDDYEFGGWRFENRFRLFEYGAVPLNPVLYVEYEALEPSHRYIRGVTGRVGEADEGEEEEEGTEHELETKLILGQDLSDRLDVAFNWINEVNLDSGDWEFGYALGVNYVLFEVKSGARHSWALKEAKLGLELFGGLGDAQEGLTLDPDETKQYAGINVKGELANGVELGVGGAFGLTDHSEDAVLRMMVGYEFD